MKTTKYFREVQPIKHPEVSRKVAFQMAENYEYEHVQEDGRFRRWGYVENWHIGFGLSVNPMERRCTTPL